MIKPYRPKALQEYLLSLKLASRVWFLKVETGNWPAIVFNEWNWNRPDGANISFTKWIDMFPILIDVVVKYEESKTWYEIRNTIRKYLWNFNGSLSNDWEWTIVFKQFLAPSYNHETNEIVFWWVYLLKQNFDYTEDLSDNETTEENANDSD